MLTLTGNFVAQNEYIASGLLTPECGALCANNYEELPQ